MFKGVIEENNWLSRSQALGEWSRPQKVNFFHAVCTSDKFSDEIYELAQEKKLNISGVINRFEERFAQDHADLVADSKRESRNYCEYGYDVS